MLQSLAACCLGLGSLTGGDAVGGRGAPGLVLEGHHSDGVLLTRLQPRLVEGGDGTGELGDHTALVVLPGDGVRKSIENEKWVKTHTHTQSFLRMNTGGFHTSSPIPLTLICPTMEM